MENIKNYFYRIVSEILHLHQNLYICNKNIPWHNKIPLTALFKIQTTLFKFNFKHYSYCILEK